MPGLSPDRIKGQPISWPMAHILLAKTRHKSCTLALQGQVSVEPAKLASL